jgi:hypothetical protein
MAWMTDKGRRDLVVAAEAVGKITVTGRKWPEEGSAMPDMARPAPSYTDRMLGERDPS